MSYTPGVIWTVGIVLLSLQITLIASLLWLAKRVRRLSKLASLATKREQAPQLWESRLAEVGAEVASLSSSFEKVSMQFSRLNSRVGMRNLRADRDEDRGPPPPGATKAELRKYYGLQAVGPDFTRQQQNLERSKE